MYHRYNTPPTARQVQILSIVADSLRTTGKAPSLREINIALGNRPRNTSGVESQLAALEVRGLLVRQDGVWRGIRVTRSGDALLEGNRDG